MALKGDGHMPIWRVMLRWARAKRGSLLVTTLAAVILVAVVLLLPTVNSGFKDSTQNSGNTFAAGIWGGFEDRMAVWARSATVTPFTAGWDGSTFGAAQPSASVGELRIMQGAGSPNRSEAVVCGVTSGGSVVGELWNGVSWTVLPALGTVSQTYWWSCDVAYEALSGDSMVVYADGSTLNYRVWNGSTWSAELSIAQSVAGTPRQLQLAAHPGSDEMVLVVSNGSSQDYAVVWNGSSWGDGVVLASDGTGNDRTDVHVAYEQQTGRAMVVFGKGTDDVYYRVWDAGWGSEFSLPGIGGGYARWMTLAVDPLSDRIALGVLTNDSDVWLAMWDGSSWTDQLTATTATTGVNRPAVAVAFEAGSGQALAVYGEAANNPRYRTWASGVGWGAQLNAPSIGAMSNSMMLFPGSGVDGIMFAVQDDDSDLHWIHWDGNSWGSDHELETDSGETKNQPFLFL